MTPIVMYSVNFSESPLKAAKHKIWWMYEDKIPHHSTLQHEEVQ